MKGVKMTVSRVNDQSLVSAEINSSPFEKITLEDTACERHHIHEEMLKDTCRTFNHEKDIELGVLTLEE